ncbi:MAG: phosphatidylserine/phosphatidylglycerophosphate/cardiolipin synthase family protein, partial [Bdellovibrionales bacterium]|nr:phosphatidylserine/phosphatidylglycerophosphate/cardiolipin synthase family protein [Bdellovibrionales bacterium]
MKSNLSRIQLIEVLTLSLLFGCVHVPVFAQVVDQAAAASKINCKDVKERKGIWESLPKGKFHLDAPEWKDLLSSLPESDQTGSLESRRVLDLVLKCFEQSKDGRELQSALAERKSIFSPVVLPKTESESGSMEWKAILDGALFTKNPAEQNFYSDNQSSVDLRLNAKELQTDVLRIIRSAKKVLSISYLEYYQDRFGLIFATELIAKKLGRSMPDADFFQSLWGLSLQQAGVVMNSAGLYQAVSASTELPRLDWKKIDQNIKVLLQGHGVSVSAASAPQIFMFLDRMRVVAPGKQNPQRLIGVLKKFGIPVAQIKNFHPNKVLRDLLAPFQMVLPLAGTNHVKITANESEVILSGGNIVDKVIFEFDSEGSKAPLMKWHDAAVRIQGPMIFDIHRFFVRHYNNAAGRGQPKVEISKMLSALEVIPQTNADGFSRLITTVNNNPLPIVNHGLTPSQTELALEYAIQNARESFYIENAFFSDIWITSLLVKKAKEWNLVQLKKQNGEQAMVPTCGKDLNSLKRKKIVVLIPKDMDQPPVKMAEISLIGFLAQAGIDICRWSGDIVNERLNAADAPDHVARYFPKTMMHTKSWQVDGKATYVGSANMNRRSIRGDLELGVLSSSKKFNEDVSERLFRRDFLDSEAPELGPQDFLLLPAALFL